MSVNRESQIASLIYNTTGLRTKVSKPGEVVMQCPYCSIDRPDKLKLYINLDKEIYHCFRCGASGRLNNLFTRLNIDTSLLNYVDSSSAETNNSQSDQIIFKPWMFELLKPKVEIKNPLYDTAVQYLASRALTPSDLYAFNKNITIVTQQINDSNELLAAISKMFLYYIIIPTWNNEYFSARLYINAPNMPRYFYLPTKYTAAQAKVFGWFGNRNYKVLNIVEGQFDGIKLHKFIPNEHVLVLGGKTKLKSYSNLIKHYSNIIYWLDSDITDNDYKLLEAFAQTVPVTFRMSFSFKDVGAINTAEDLATFKQLNITYLRLKSLTV